MSRVRYALKFLAALAFSFHAVAIFAISFPANNRPLALLQHATFDYLRITGTWQSWTMFTGVPRYHSHQFHIEATTQDGEIVKFDPILPGLRPVDRDVRNTTFLTRVMATLVEGGRA